MDDEAHADAIGATLEAVANEDALARLLVATLRIFPSESVVYIPVSEGTLDACHSDVALHVELGTQDVAATESAHMVVGAQEDDASPPLPSAPTPDPGTPEPSESEGSIWRFSAAKGAATTLDANNEIVSIEYCMFEYHDTSFSSLLFKSFVVSLAHFGFLVPWTERWRLPQAQIWRWLNHVKAQDTGH